MRGLRKGISAVLTAALVLTAVPVNGNNQVYAAEETAVDATVKVLPDQASTFHDTDNDGLGEFEGWGTSLCWWANRLGYDTTMTQKAAKAFFNKDEGLGLNIGRYNIGGGDNTGEVEDVDVPVNPKATILGVEKKTGVLDYNGNSDKMKVSTESRFADAVYLYSDADFGFTKGKKVGSFQYVGWVKQMDGAVGDGDNLHYNVNASAAGTYTVKLLAYHNAKLERDIAIKVNGTTEHVVSAEELMEHKIAEASSKGLFLATIKNVALNQGSNTIEVAGKKEWTLDFVKFLVVKSGEEGVLPEMDDTLHAPHIKRSDSNMPGYWKDVTKITVTPMEGFARVDEECGYAWNYDWTKDENQRNILKAAKAASGAEFIAEAFSNSPPYFMTNSGCTSGALDSSKDNLRKDSYHAFAAYMADVITHYAEEGIVDFTSATPMNEPYTNYWGANSAKQEGCHFDQGESESTIIVELKKELAKKAEAATDAKVKATLENIILSGTDETSIDTAITSYNALSDEAKASIARIDTHTYSGSKRAELSELAKKENKNLWMSEIDGASQAGTNAGEMAAGLGFAQRIITDINGLKCSAWIMWNAVDLNIDENNEFDANSLDELRNKKNDSGEVMYDPENKGWWGIAIGDHNNKDLILTRKYYAYGQFSRYIRPGYTIMGTSDAGNTLIAYDKKSKKAVIVAVNTAGTDETWKFDLGRFETMGNKITAYRTSGGDEGGENWVDVSTSVNAVADTANRSFTAKLKANSITTYIVEGVEFDKEKDDERAKRAADLDKMQTEVMNQMDLSSLKLKEIKLSASMVSGSAPWNNDTTNGVTNVVDNDLVSFFDGVAEGYVQIDLGEGKETAIVAYGYAPRYVNNDSQYLDRCVGATLYGSNDGKEWDALHTITKMPEGGKINYAYMNEFKSRGVIGKAYRYYKYAVDASGNCNIAELKLYEMPADLVIPELPDTLEEWVTYCEGKTEGRDYVAAGKTKYEAALAAAKALNSSATQEQKENAMYALFDAYLALKEIPSSFTGVEGAEMYDMDGKVIQAHGGQIQKITYDHDFDGNGTIDADEHEFWYWIGEDKTNNYRPCPGVHVYISQDLYKWKDMGCVLRTVPDWETFTTDKYFTDLYGSMNETQKKAVYGDLWTSNNSSSTGCVIERPKMIYNEKTNKYVIWFHADGQTPDSSGGNYAKAKAGVAVSDSPFGPFQLQGSYLLNYDESLDHGFDGNDDKDKEVLGHVRDMNLFKDDDGTGYVIYSSDGNQNMYIAKLNDSYTNIAQPDNAQAEQGVGKDYTVNFIGSSREAPAMFEYKNKYYLVTSGCTGWAPNQAKYAVADHPMGPWREVGDPCAGNEEASTTYRTQPTCVFEVGDGQYIYMGDRWSNPDTGNELKNSRYVWLPVEFTADGGIALRRHSNWKLEKLFELELMDILTELPTVVKSGESMNLPNKLNVKLFTEDTPREVDVTWNTDEVADGGVGQVEVTGTISYQKAGGERKRTITHEVMLVNDKLIYFFDCASYFSDYFDLLNEQGVALRNEKTDQEYTVENLAGYTGKRGEGIGADDTEYDFGVKEAGNDMWTQGYFATSGKSIDYAFILEPGRYTAATGYHEWWDGDRNTKIVVKSGDETLVESNQFAVEGSESLQKNVSFELTKSAKVTVSIVGIDQDPILSWIAVIQNAKTGELEGEEDKTELNALLASAEKVERGSYTSESWEKFQAALKNAKDVQKYVLATAEDILSAKLDLEDAKNALQSVNKYLQSMIDVIAISSSDESKYAKDAMWDYYGQVLADVRGLAAKNDLTEDQAEDALAYLRETISLLTPAPKPVTPPATQKKDQTISVKASFAKTYGDKAFNLGAKRTGDGALTYKSSSNGVATVDKNGKVTIKGTGSCTITITAAETANYKAKSVNVTITVKPKKMSIKKVTVAKKSLKVTFKKDSKATGYEIQCSLTKNFKKIAGKADVKKTSATLKKLKKGKKYYVRIRAYKTATVNGKKTKLTGAWSKVKPSKKVK